MRRIKILLIGIITSLLIPGFVLAANASISVKTNGSAVVGNTITTTVTVSSSSAMGSWQFLINYDNSKLKLVSGETSVADYTTSASGVKSKSYTLKFQALKSGTAFINVGSYLVYGIDESKMSVSAKSATVSIKTQAEIEASYSKNAYLKSLGVDGYNLNPAFNKDTFEYSLEVENSVEKVNISGSVEDSKSRVNGLGEVSLTEGINKFEIIVTAQKGNTLKYTVNIDRKELEPIAVKYNNNDYTVVRKNDALINYSSFTVGTTLYNDTEIPALTNDEMTLIGLKDSDGNINMYVYENGEVKKLYVELKSNLLMVNPLDLVESRNLSFLKKTNIEVSGLKIDAYEINKSDNVIIYALNLETKEKGYYLFNTKTGIISIYDEYITENLNSQVKNYKYVVFACLGLIILLLILLIFKRKRKTKVKKVEEKLSKSIESEKSE